MSCVFLPSCSPSKIVSQKRTDLDRWLSRFGFWCWPSGIACSVCGGNNTSPVFSEQKQTKLVAVLSLFYGLDFGKFIKFFTSDKRSLKTAKTKFYSFRKKVQSLVNSQYFLRFLCKTYQPLKLLWVYLKSEQFLRQTLIFCPNSH